jgi:hypothetical protein
MLGQLVEIPAENLTKPTVFAGAVGIGDAHSAFNRSKADPGERINSCALLKARLLDVFIGDWDRHRGQWRWAKSADDNRWRPMPQNRDEAFCRLDGLFPSMSKNFAPQMVGFDAEYPKMYNLTFNGREIDRRFLVDLDKPVWDSLAIAMQSQLTDAVIEAAVRRLPPEMYAIDGKVLENQLKVRRDHLHEAADEYYRLLAETVEIHATDVADIVQVTESFGKVVVSITVQDATTPYFYRRFDPAETKEIRLRMHGGNDRVEVAGTPKLPITVRVIGGTGDDEVEYISATKGVKFYDHQGSNRISGQKSDKHKINDRPYKDWQYTPENRGMPLDWGKWNMPIALFGLTGDYGLLLGYGRTFYNYGFRKQPYAQRYSVSGALTSRLKWEAKVDADFRWENKPWHNTVNLKLSTLDVVHFYGFGNDTKREQDIDFYQIDRWEILLAPAFAYKLGRKELRQFGPLAYLRETVLSFGAAGRFSSTKAKADKISGLLPDIYGGARFGQVAFYSRFRHDNRDVRAYPTRGTTLKVLATYVPAIWDIKSDYGFLDAVGRAYVSTPGPLDPVIAMRAGGRKIWGDFPYFDAAFIGGRESLRGYDDGRFAGDAALYAGADLRLELLKTNKLLLTNLGLFGFIDAGRVWLDGESPGKLHTGYGGGIWGSFIGRPNTASLGVAFGGDHKFMIYVLWGFAI